MDMSRTDLTTTVCYDFFTDRVDVTYDVRTILSGITILLSPGYMVLSLVAVLSRYNKILKELSSHGKTSTAEETTEKKQSTSPSWCWVSKRWFSHFYFVGIMSTFVTTINHMECYREKILHRSIDRDLYDKILLVRTAAVVLLVIHVFRRSYECLHIQQHSDQSSKMHIAGYALGFGYYMVLPLVFWDIDVTNSSLLFDTSNNNLKEEHHTFGFGRIKSSAGMSTTICILFLGISSGINLWLQYEQHMHHVILADIRRISNKDKLDNKTKAVCEIKLPKHQQYSLPPHRRWFRYVLSPHYLAEILLYFSFAVILEMAPVAVQNNSFCPTTSSNTHELFIYFGSMAQFLVVVRRYRHWALFVWVTTNLTVSAMNNYDWYYSRYVHNKNNNKSGNSKKSNTSTMILRSRREDVFEKRTAIFPKML